LLHETDRRGRNVTAFIASVFIASVFIATVFIAPMRCSLIFM
jgi:hypothetical protein